MQVSNAKSSSVGTAQAVHTRCIALPSLHRVPSLSSGLHRSVSKLTPPTPALPAGWGLGHCLIKQPQGEVTQQLPLAQLQQHTPVTPLVQRDVTQLQRVTAAALLLLG
jgi:hypothetical protein